LYTAYKHILVKYNPQMHSLYLTRRYFTSRGHVFPTLDEAQVVVLKASFFLILILQRIGPQKMDDGLIEIVSFWSSAFAGELLVLW